MSGRKGRARGKSEKEKNYIRKKGRKQG